MNSNFMKRISLFMCALLCLNGCAYQKIHDNAKDNIVIAAASDTERQILAEIVKQQIEHDTNLHVSIVNNLGSTTLIHTTMLKGEVNVAAGMYTGTSLTGELKMKPERDSQKALQIVQKEYDKRYSRTWFPSYGFANTYAFMVRKDFAKKHQLTKISDLEKLQTQVKVGVDTAWMDRKGDGYADFKEQYGFGFSKIYPMDLGLLYTAVKNQEMDVIVGYSTDGRIASYELVLLEDDKGLFPAYDCSVVATNAILKKHPQMKKSMEKLCGTIDTATMQQMNKMAAEDLMAPNLVAKQFLKQHQYFEKRRR